MYDPAFDAMVGQMLMNTGQLATAATQEAADYAKQATQATKTTSTPIITDPTAAAAAAGMQAAAQQAQQTAPQKTDWGAVAGKSFATLTNALQPKKSVDQTPVIVTPVKTDSHTALWIALGIVGVGALGVGIYFATRRK